MNFGEKFSEFGSIFGILVKLWVLILGQTQNALFILRPLQRNYAYYIIGLLLLLFEEFIYVPCVKEDI